jgi:hypothetical protein
MSDVPAVILRISHNIARETVSKAKGIPVHPKMPPRKNRTKPVVNSIAILATEAGLNDNCEKAPLTSDFQICISSPGNLSSAAITILVTVVIVG